MPHVRCAVVAVGLGLVEVVVVAPGLTACGAGERLGGGGHGRMSFRAAVCLDQRPCQIHDLLRRGVLEVEVTLPAADVNARGFAVELLEFDEALRVSRRVPAPRP